MSSRSAVPSINLTDLPLAKARAALVKWPVVTMTTPAARCRFLLKIFIDKFQEQTPFLR